MNIAIFGTGIDGRRLHRYLRKKKKINFFLDSNPSLDKKKFFGIPIYCPQKSKNILQKTQLVYLGGRYMDEQEKYLKSAGFKGRIFKTERWKFKASKKELKIREKKLLNLLKQLIKIFELNNINYFMDASSLLALFRNQKLSEFSDIDIAIPDQDLSYLLKLVKSKMKNCLIEANYFNFRNFLIKKGSLIQVVITSKCNLYEREPVNIEFYNEIPFKGKFIRFIPDDLISKVPKRFREDYQFVSYSKTKIRVTKYPEECLEYFYGNNWRIMNKNWKNKDSKKRFIKLKNFKKK